MIVSFPTLEKTDKSLLAIFAKEPLPGKVKTRLSPPLGPDQAADLYSFCLRETVSRMTAALFQTVLFFSGRRAYFLKNFPGLSLFSQGQGSLGERMANAFETTLAEGCSKMVLIGTDSPDIPCRIITAAFAALETKEVVVSPARDGGYVLIGESRHHPELFSAMPWGSGEVLALTRERALRAGLRYLELESWDDIDDVLSLQRFLRRSPASPVSVYARQQLKSIIKDLAP